jgi:hypothetical protein
LQSERAIRERSPIRRRSSRRLLERGQRALVLAEHVHHSAEVVERDCEHEVVACRARESDRFIARSHCRPTIGRTVAGLGPDGAQRSGGDRGLPNGADLFRAGEARLEQGDRLLLLVLLSGEVSGAVEHPGAGLRRLVRCRVERSPQPPAGLCEMAVHVPVTRIPDGANRPAERASMNSGGG